MGAAFEKSKAFGKRIIRLCDYLRREKKELVLSKQLLRSGTSIGANLAEAECAMSRKDFTAKVYVVLKECAETQYWLELLRDTGYMTDEQYDSIEADAAEIRRILTATTRTMADTRDGKQS